MDVLDELRCSCWAKKVWRNKTSADLKPQLGVQYFASCWRLLLARWWVQFQRCRSKELPWLPVYGTVDLTSCLSGLGAVSRFIRLLCARNRFHSPKATSVTCSLVSLLTFESFCRHFSSRADKYEKSKVNGHLDDVLVRS